MCGCVLWEGRSPPSVEGMGGIGKPVECRIHSDMYWAPTGAHHSPDPGRSLADVMALALSSCLVVMPAAVCRHPGRREPPFYPGVSLIRGRVHAGSAHQPKELCCEGSSARQSVQSRAPFFTPLPWDKARPRASPSPYAACGPSPAAGLPSPDRAARACGGARSQVWQQEGRSEA